jgi:hypothetical protein
LLDGHQLLGHLLYRRVRRTLHPLACLTPTQGRGPLDCVGTVKRSSSRHVLPRRGPPI